MGIYFDDKRGAWRWQFKAVVAGERHRRSKLLPKGTTEAQARKFDEAETARTYAQIAQGKPRSSTVPGISEAVALYLKDTAPANKQAAIALKQMIPFFDGRGLDELGAVSREFTEAMQKPQEKTGKPQAPGTIAHRLSYLRAACRHALRKHGLGSADWIARMSFPSVSNARTIFLSRAEVLRLARAIKHFDTRALILVTFGTGSRPGECYRAEVTQDALVMQETKNGSRHVAPVPAHLRRYLRHWPHPRAYITHERRLQAVRDALGLPGVHLHDLRHSTASALLSKGATLAQIGLVLNHKSPASTNRYAHLAMDEKAALLEGIFGKKSPTSR